MAVSQGSGPMGMSDRELKDCYIFESPTVARDAATGNAYNRDELAINPQLQNVHDKIQSSVAAKLRRDQFRLQPAKMILARAKQMRTMSAEIIAIIKAYKASLITAGTYSNEDINKLVDSKYDEVYKDMNDKLDIEYPCNEEAKKLNIYFYIDIIYDKYVTITIAI